MCPCVTEYFLKCLPKLHPRRHYCLFLPVNSAEGGAVLIHQRSRTRAPRFFACFAGRPLAIRTRKTLLFTRAIRKTASSTLSAASQLIFAHKVALPSYLFVSRFSCKREICPLAPRGYSSPAPFAKARLRRSPLLRSSFLLIKWRSLRTFL